MATIFNYLQPEAFKGYSECQVLSGFTPTPTFDKKSAGWTYGLHFKRL